MTAAASRRDGLNAAVFASGSGSNFQALIDHRSVAASWKISLLVVDRAGAGALQRAETVGIPSVIVPVVGRDADDVGREMLSELQKHAVDVVFLAGYLRLIPDAVVHAFPRRMLNVHPALLPAFGGKGMYGRHVHRAVIESGARVSGPTVHFVDEEYDRGDIIAQWPVPVRRTDTPEVLAARVLAMEHRLYPAAADHVCSAIVAGAEPGPLDPGGERFRIED